ncbi:DUF2059 domain-containing protein [Loktanella sp. M215]|uniref:DUF2059 domain-containing protein n=1 Tax=Loktanella sp. M215 TaxID=2675431 RepID=UPI001F1B422B|nr:DUF2059 domain-containing protein [Loktanella sp. M215]
MLHAARTLFLAPLALIATLTGAHAQAVDAEKGAALFDALGLPEMIEIMREEGLAYGQDINDGLLSGAASAAWDKTVSDIYDVDRMRGGAAAALNTALSGKDVDAMLAFFTSDLGQEIIGLETSARRALLDDAVDTAAKEAAAIALADDTPRSRMITTFAQTNDLIDTNVVGAMNANFAFYMGLQDGGAYDSALTEDQVLADVYNQEPEIRNNTTEWVYGFLSMAYQPLSDDDLQAYIDFSRTKPGQDLNVAMFEAFDQMFVTISRDLGRASALTMAGQDI